MTATPIRDVADTAYWVAWARALETARGDALFRDPFAERLAGERGRQIAEQMPAATITAWNIVLRTHVIDGYVARAVREGCEVVLNLGAGLDTRPYRLELPPELRWIEVDQRSVIEDKAAKLADERARCRLERVSLDLTDLSARRTFFDEVDAASKRVLVLTEGLVPYLSVEEVATLAADLRARPRFGGWVVDYFSPQTLEYRRRAGITAKAVNAPFRFYPPDWFAFFEAAGWRVREMRYLPEEGERLGRPFPATRGMRAVMRLLRLLGQRRVRDAFRRSTGFALLEPAS